jgi:hypothetical protein
MMLSWTFNQLRRKTTQARALGQVWVAAGGFFAPVPPGRTDVDQAYWLRDVTPEQSWLVAPTPDQGWFADTPSASYWEEDI